MKKIVFLLLAMFTAFSLSFAFETRMDDDPEEAIPLQFNEHGEGGDGNNIRGGVFMPIIATYNPSTSCVCIVFLSNVGDIDIRLTNLTTGGVSYVQANANSGSIFIPIIYGNGFYSLEFISEGTTMYYGYFNVI